MNSNEANEKGSQVDINSVDPAPPPSVDFKKLVDDAVSEKFKDKDYVVRDVQHDAFDGLMKIVRHYAYLIGIILASLVAIFATVGIKTIGNFYVLIQPQLKAVQAAISTGQQNIHNQQLASNDNEEKAKSLRQKLDDQQRVVDNVSQSGAALDSQVKALKSQLDSLKQQASAVIAQDTENHLESHFSTFDIGTPTVMLEGAPVKTPENKDKKPTVYLAAFNGALQDHNMSDIHRFDSGLKTLDYILLSGNYYIQSGKQVTGTGLIPNQGCTSVIYYDPVYQSQASKVASLISTSFHIDPPPVKLVRVDSPLIDTASRMAIQVLKINIAASVYLPEQSFCPGLLKSY